MDFNRCGVPLIEMVTEPDLRSPAEARAFLQEVRALARALGVSDASPEEGKMRADVNVSLTRPGGAFGTKVEVKNLNSFRSVEAALAFEIRRQSRVIEDGYAIVQETRGWNEGGQKTVSQRSKEEASDYRYMPDPDLPEIRIPRAHVDAVRSALPEVPAAKRRRYVEAGVKHEDAEAIAYDTAVARFFDDACAHWRGPPQTVANWLLSEVAGRLRQEERTLAETQLTPERLTRLLALIDDGTIGTPVAKELLPDVMRGSDPARLVEERGLGRVADEAALGALVEQVMADNPAVVASAKEQPKAINALLGRVMKASRGRADPAVVRRLLETKLHAHEAP